VSDFDYSPTHSSTVTPLNGSGINDKFFNSDNIGKKDKKGPIPNLQRDLKLNNDSSSTTTSCQTWVSDGCHSRFDVGLKGATSYQDMDFERDELYSPTSTLTSLSGPHGSRLNGDLNWKYQLSDCVKSKFKDFGPAKLEFRSKSETSDEGRLTRDSMRVEVVSRGTRLMRTIKFPTVIVQIQNKKLKKSMIYYIVLKSVGRYVGDIICLLFASNYRSETEQRAELLPLSMVPSTNRSLSFELDPMLLNERYSGLFEVGCTFKVKAIESGRRIDLRWSL